MRIRQLIHTLAIVSIIHWWNTANWFIILQTTGTPMKLISLTDTYGDTLSLDPEAIVCMYADYDARRVNDEPKIVKGTRVVLAGNGELMVREHVTQIAQLVADADLGIPAE